MKDGNSRAEPPFNKIEITLGHCTFTNNRAEDTLNIVQSKYHLKDIDISGTVSDGFDADFAEGVGTDAVGKNRSKLKITDSTIKKIVTPGLMAYIKSRNSDQVPMKGL